MKTATIIDQKSGAIIRQRIERRKRRVKFFERRYQKPKQPEPQRLDIYA